MAHVIISGALLRPTSFYEKRDIQKSEEERYLQEPPDDIDEVDDSRKNMEVFSTPLNGVQNKEILDVSQNKHTLLDANSTDTSGQLDTRSEHRISGHVGTHKLLSTNNSLISDTTHAPNTVKLSGDMQGVKGKCREDMISQPKSGSAPINGSAQQDNTHRVSSLSRLDSPSLLDISFPMLPVQLPVLEQDQTESTKLTSKNFLPLFLFNLSLQQTVILLSCGSASYISTVFLLPAFCESSGISKEHAAILISIMGAVEGVGRLVIGYIGDLKCTSKRVLLILIYLISGTACLAVVHLPSFVFFVGFAILYGLFGGAFTIFVSVLLAEVVDLKHLTTVIGYYFLISGMVTSGLIAVLG